MITRDDILGAVVKAFKHAENEDKQMDSDLAFSIAEEIIKLLTLEEDAR